MTKGTSAPRPDRPAWWERLIAGILGIAVGPVFGFLASILLVLSGASLWVLLLAPLAGLIIGPVVGLLFPKSVIYLFDHTSVMGKPLTLWLTDAIS